MVAYNFQKQFVDLIASGKKCQTVRATRKRQAKVGDTLQLYTGMRTRQCSKIIDDVICTRVEPIKIAISDLIDVKIVNIAINHVLLTRDEIEAFAKADGFENRKKMGEFWLSHHGQKDFIGNVIYWE